MYISFFHHQVQFTVFVLHPPKDSTYIFVTDHNAETGMNRYPPSQPPESTQQIACGAT